MCVYLLLNYLQCHHDERNSVLNHQPHDCLLDRLFMRRSQNTSKLRVTDLCAENSALTGRFPHKKLVTWKCFHLMTSSCICVSESCLHRHYFYNPDTSPSPLQILLDRIWIPMAISPEVSPIDSVCQYHTVARTRYLTELNVTKETFWI